MKIGVVSDTHSKELPEQMLKDFGNVEFIIHAGDFCQMEDYEALSRIKEVKGVYGNMDDAQIRKRFPRRQILDCGALKIGLYHGEGPPGPLFNRIREEFADETVDVVIFGHSHHPMNETIDGVLYFNPGSPNDRVFAPYCSYGMLEVSGKKATGEIIKVKDNG